MHDIGICQFLGNNHLYANDSSDLAIILKWGTQLLLLYT